jgi:hypothetical protein
MLRRRIRRLRPRRSRRRRRPRHRGRRLRCAWRGARPSRLAASNLPGGIVGGVVGAGKGLNSAGIDVASRPVPPRLPGSPSAPGLARRTSCRPVTLPPTSCRWPRLLSRQNRTKHPARIRHRPVHPPR